VPARELEAWALFGESECPLARVALVAPTRQASRVKWAVGCNAVFYGGCPLPSPLTLVNDEMSRIPAVQAASCIAVGLRRYLRDQPDPLRVIAVVDIL
jgi:hypothetical protein